MNTDAFHHWPCDQIATLMFCVDQDRVLLIHKKRGLGAGMINGPGGKLEPNEDLLACACRETAEETGIITTQARAAGVLCFSFSEGLKLRVHPFVSHEFSGVMQETDEATPFWQSIRNIPYERMWADDQLWLAHVLAGGQVHGHCLFDGERILEHNLTLS